MDIQGTISIISLILAPVVMVSCCTLFLNGQLQRYDALGNRIRTMDQERLETLGEVDNDVSSALKAIDGLHKLRVHEIEAQLPHLLRRHMMLHNGAPVIGLAILICILSMFLIAMAVLLQSSVMAIIALCIFLTATVTMLLGGTMIMFELYLSHLAVEYEVMHEMNLEAKAPALMEPSKRKRAIHDLRRISAFLKK